MKRRISTPKKVALVVLGALTLLTLVNLVEANLKKSSSHEHAFHVDSNHESSVHYDTDKDSHIDVDVQIDDHDFKFNIKTNKEALKNEIKSAINTKELDIRVQVADLGELMKEKSFDVRQGELMSVEVGDANVVVQTHDQSEAMVSIFLDAQNMRKAQDYFEEQNFDITYDGSGVYVRTNPTRKNNSWDASGGAEITVKVTIPSVFNADIRTSDGNIVLSDLEGEGISLHTSDGDVKTQSILGNAISIRTSDGDIQTAVLEAENIHIRTSDGDISVEDLNASKLLIRTSDGDIKGNSIEGEAAISTSDGDINVSRLEGKEFNIRTSDGEIFVDHLASMVSKIQTSDGNIVLRDASGDVTAKTSSGNLRVSLDQPTNVYLRTGSGDIFVEAPPSYSASLYVKADQVQVAEGFGFSGEIQEDFVDGTINGGSFKFEARTTDGKVFFREN